jgi:hypothetical protein
MVVVTTNPSSVCWHKLNLYDKDGMKNFNQKIVCGGGRGTGLRFGKRRSNTVLGGYHNLTQLFRRFSTSYIPIHLVENLQNNLEQGTYGANHGMVKEHERVSPGWGHLEIIAGVHLHILGMVTTLSP